ncbi:MAG: CAP domain-containing protein [Anaerolineae bacterium]|nr:CAP domain-containing protein [Anaerolineae bacterium]
MSANLHRITSRFGIFLTLILILSHISTLAAQSVATSDTGKASEILTEINNWRLQQGLWPVKLNPTLIALAESQATHLAQFPEFPTDYTVMHTDSQGRSPGERAIAEPFNWPKYMPNSQAAIGENAAVTGSVASAMTFWRGSAIHSQATLNSAYREVGIAAIKYGSRYIFIVVFGSRPNVFPATYNANDGLIYLSNERFRWASGSNAIKDVTRIRLFDSEGRPLTADWQAWSPSIQPPAGAGNRLFILLSDGTQDTLTEVTLGNTPSTQPAANSLANAPATTIPNTASGATTFNLPTVVPVNANMTSFSFNATAVPTAIPTAVPLVFATPQPGAASPDISLLYDARSLFLVNSSSGTVNLSGISITGNGRTLTLERWAQFAGNLNLGAFPAGSCLQAEQSGTNAAAPGLCRLVRSIVEYQPGQVFWANNSFTVMRGSQTLATCDPTAGRCEVDLG